VGSGCRKLDANQGRAQAIEFYKKAFGAEEAMRFPLADGKTMHAEIRIGGAVVMLHDARRRNGTRSARRRWATPRAASCCTWTTPTPC
jgi:uncharacterized glyoxalase superfamily protein PhnB